MYKRAAPTVLLRQGKRRSARNSQGSYNVTEMARRAMSAAVEEKDREEAKKESTREQRLLRTVPIGKMGVGPGGPPTRAAPLPRRLGVGALPTREAADEVVTEYLLENRKKEGITGMRREDIERAVSLAGAEITNDMGAAEAEVAAAAAALAALEAAQAGSTEAIAARHRVELLSRLLSALEAADQSVKALQGTPGPELEAAQAAQAAALKQAQMAGMTGFRAAELLREERQAHLAALEAPAVAAKLRLERAKAAHVAHDPEAYAATVRKDAVTRLNATARNRVAKRKRTKQKRLLDPTIGPRLPLDHGTLESRVARLGWGVGTVGSPDDGRKGRLGPALPRKRRRTGSPTGLGERSSVAPLLPRGELAPSSFSIPSAARGGAKRRTARGHRWRWQRPRGCTRRRRGTRRQPRRGTKRRRRS